jgi:hypothetical protein
VTPGGQQLIVGVLEHRAKNTSNSIACILGALGMEIAFFSLPAQAVVPVSTQELRNV